MARRKTDRPAKVGRNPTDYFSATSLRSSPMKTASRSSPRLCSRERTIGSAQPGPHSRERTVTVSAWDRVAVPVFCYCLPSSAESATPARVLKVDAPMAFK